MVAGLGYGGLFALVVVQKTTRKFMLKMSNGLAILRAVQIGLIMLEPKDIEYLKRERARVSESLYQATVHRLAVFRNVSWGIFAGVLLTGAILDVTELVFHRLIGGCALILLAAYKLYARSEEKANWARAEQVCPHKVLYPESYPGPQSQPSTSAPAKIATPVVAAPKGGGCLFEVIIGAVLLILLYFSLYALEHPK